MSDHTQGYHLGGMRSTKPYGPEDAEPARWVTDAKLAWLIEWPGDDNMPTRYWHPETGWMLDPHKGCWFSREGDAEAFARRERLSFTRVAEHKFGLTLAPHDGSAP